MARVKNARGSASPSPSETPATTEPEDSKNSKGSKAKGKETQKQKGKKKEAVDKPLKTLPLAEKKGKKLGRYAEEANHTNFRSKSYYANAQQNYTRRSTRGNPIDDMATNTPTSSAAPSGAPATSSATVATPVTTTVANPATAITNAATTAVAGVTNVASGSIFANLVGSGNATPSSGIVAPIASSGPVNVAATLAASASGTTGVANASSTASGTTNTATSALNVDTTSGIASSADPTTASLGANTPTTASSQHASAPRTGSGRDRKPARKAREAKGTTVAAAKDNEKGFKEVESPLRFTLDGKVSTTDYQERPLIFQPVYIEGTRADQVFNQLLEHPQDSWKKNWKYNVAVPDLAFQATKFTGTEQDPYGPRLSFSARGENMYFSSDGLTVTNTHGWQSVRANVALKEGTYFWEVKVLSNSIDDNNIAYHPSELPGGHVRVGIMRPEGNIEANLGIDGYSYAITDHNMRLIHDGYQQHIEKDSGRSFRIDDVFGLRLTLPPLAVHRKVADGSYNPAVDGPDTWSSPDYINPAQNIVRDRNPFFFKQRHLYFEQQNYNHEDLGQANPTIAKGWKGMIDRLYSGGDKSYRNTNPPPVKDDGLQAPNPNHPDPRFRTLPGSKLELFRNGEYMGIIVEDLLAFLVPCSKLHSGGEDRPPGREYADDSSLGYYPAVSCYYGGAAECRFEAPFWFPPPTVDDMAITTADESGPSTKKSKKGKSKTPVPAPNRRVHVPVETKSLADRYNEQVAEEIVYDIIDEVEAGLADEVKALDDLAESGFVTASAHMEE